ncbi:MAG: hypothetical protein ACE5JI_11535 [Acidobacteriota bacterium]
MFEMILQTAPDDLQNYLALKDIYRQLKRVEDFKRVVKGLAGVYLASGQKEDAAREYAEVLEVDPTDGESLEKLEDTGYTETDFPALKVEAKLKEIRNKYEQKLGELREAEEALLKATANARNPADGGTQGQGEGTDHASAWRAVPPGRERKTQQLVAEHERWLTEGRLEVFNQVAKTLKKEADRIIETNEYGDIRKSVREAEKLIASTDRVFQEEWERVRTERESEFREKFEDMKRQKKVELQSARQQVVERAREDEAAAERGLKEVERELRQLETELEEKERLLRARRKVASGEGVARGQSRRRRDTRSPEVVVIAPNPMVESSKPPEETADDDSSRKVARDEPGKTLGAILVQHGLVTRQHIEEAIAEQKKNHRPIGQILVESGYATEEDIIGALVAQAGVPYLPLGNYDIRQDVATTISKEVASKYALMPVDRIAGTLLVAMGIPLNKEQKVEVERHAQGMNVTYFISSWSDIKAKHEQHYD